jgi:threonine synthase
MRFISTRGGDSATFSEAVIQGLAKDGGLFVPETLPDLRPFLTRWRDLPYTKLATEFLALFATDIPAPELRSCVEDAYASFPNPDSPAPIIPIGNDGRISVLELFHGPTLAFKDFALQLLGRLYGRHIHATKHPVNILGASSGDTGSAAIHGMLAQPGVHSFILYPEGRVAELQERQIACTGSPRVHPLAVHGNFDDAQAIVKEIFGDPAFTAAHHLTAVNSINIARILAQCVYYLHTALKFGATTEVSLPLEFVVPTGNFGNVLAGWLLSRMGLSNLRYHVTTNANAVVSTFFQTGEYRPGTVFPSLAPSMDIQQASNFERWLWWHFKGNFSQVKETLAALKRGNPLALGYTPEANISAASCDDETIRSTIQRVWKDFHYVCDPHTATAFASVLNKREEVRSVILATAHPAKFPDTIEEATGTRPTHPSLELLKNRPVVKQVLPAEATAIRAAIETALSAAA